MTLTPDTIEAIADRLGRRAIADAVGVRLTAVSNAVARDKRFPSSWFLVLSKLAADAGFEMRPELCGMKPMPMSVPQSVEIVNNQEGEPRP